MSDITLDAEFDLCLFCKRAHPKLEQVVDGDWRISCYGCSMATFDFPTPEEAIQSYRKHVQAAFAPTVVVYHTKESEGNTDA